MLIAQDKAAKRKRRRTKLASDALMKSYVMDYLKQGWSPEQIAVRLRAKIGKTLLNHKTIYPFIDSEKGRNLRLDQYLRSRREKRYPKIARKSRTTIANRTSITYIEPL